MFIAIKTVAHAAYKIVKTKKCEYFMLSRAVHTFDSKFENCLRIFYKLIFFF